MHRTQHRAAAGALALLLFVAPALLAQGSAGTMMPGVLGIPMERMGSGTTWIPDAVPLPSRHIPAGGWDVMLHGFIFAQYDWQSGPRGDEQLGSLNWAMVMASHAAVGGTLQGRVMLSLDPATVGPSGYPLLVQSGEVHRGEPLHDRQHPHDFFMEVGALYERPVSADAAFFLYAAPSGEPALGPVAFMHRPSAMDNPIANLSHHWQDATHIAFGVLTAGVFTRQVKVEGSFFNGREPDEHRWNFDRLRLDSWSARVTVNPGASWSLTAGYGYLDSPEELHPEESMRRATASVLHGRRLGEQGQWSSALVWGMNHHGADRSPTHGVLAESEAILDGGHTVFGRAEHVQKSAEDLALEEDSFAPERVFGLWTGTFGYIREIGRWRWATIGIGGQGIVNVLPAALEPVYGSRTPAGALVFLRVRPYHVTPAMDHRRMDHGDHQGSR